MPTFSIQIDATDPRARELLRLACQSLADSLDGAFDIDLFDGDECVEQWEA